ncbi:MAG TPA: toll/interleukin-1 receptor domain-containing protein [Ktedonobacteraceae bacterium]|nr:toll/interleukin-1 receptor domain-containing protein [Ktedonobacteraceae bacterium]
MASHKVQLSCESDLSGTNFTGTRFWNTFFVQVDLNNVEGLEAAVHEGPSTVNINSVVLPHNEATRLHFLRGVGFTETQVEYLPSLLISRPIEYQSLFISYSSKDQEFAKRLYADLRKKDVPCWFAPEDLRIGDKFRVRIDESIRLYDKLLLILSEHSVRSPWVETEVETTFSKEHKTGKLALFPVKLDNTVEETEEAWAATIHRTRHIGDFTRWKEHDEYQKGLSRLLRDLKQEALHDTIESDANKDEKQSTSREMES